MIISRICDFPLRTVYFAGYSGGAKAVMPGVSTREAIQANHRRMVQPEACAGRIKGNPVREDIEEAGALVGIDFIVNVVLDEHKEILQALESRDAERGAVLVIKHLERSKMRAGYGGFEKE